MISGIRFTIRMDIKYSICKYQQTPDANYKNLCECHMSEYPVFRFNFTAVCRLEYDSFIAVHFFPADKRNLEHSTPFFEGERLLHGCAVRDDLYRAFRPE